MFWLILSHFFKKYLEANYLITYFEYQSTFK